MFLGCTVYNCDWCFSGYHCCDFGGHTGPIFRYSQAYFEDFWRLFPLQSVQFLVHQNQHGKMIEKGWKSKCQGFQDLNPPPSLQGLSELLLWNLPVVLQQIGAMLQKLLPKQFQGLLLWDQPLRSLSSTLPRFQLESCVAKNSHHQIHQTQAGDASTQQDDHSYRCSMSLTQIKRCSPGSDPLRIGSESLLEELERTSAWDLLKFFRLNGWCGGWGTKIPTYILSFHMNIWIIESFIISINLTGIKCIYNHIYILYNWHVRVRLPTL